VRVGRNDPAWEGRPPTLHRRVATTGYARDRRAADAGASRRRSSAHEPPDEKHARILLDVVGPRWVDPVPAVAVLGSPYVPVPATLAEPTGPGIGERDPESDAAPPAIDRELLEARDQEPTDATRAQ